MNAISHSFHPLVLIPSSFRWKPLKYSKIIILIIPASYESGHSRKQITHSGRVTEESAIKGYL